jgi:hypothetical protein
MLRHNPVSATAVLCTLYGTATACLIRVHRHVFIYCDALLITRMCTVAPFAIAVAAPDWRQFCQS